MSFFAIVHLQEEQLPRSPVRYVIVDLPDKNDAVLHSRE